MGTDRGAGVLVLALAACGGGGQGARDGAAADAADSSDAAGADARPDAALPPDPVPPAPPVLTPCPTGWRVVAGAVTACDPWPAGGAVTVCPAGQAHFPGQPGCATVGDPCPSGEWPVGLPAGRPVRYVRAGGGTGGSGTMASPYRRIADAMAGTSAGTIVALGKGDFGVDVTLGPGVTLWGACAGATRIVAPGAAITWQGAGGEVRDLALAAGERGLVVPAGASGVAQGIVIERAVGVGIHVLGTLSGGDWVVRDVAPDTGGSGPCLQASAGAQVAFARALFERCRARGVMADGAATLVRASDLAVRGVTGTDYGYGVSAELGGAAELARAVFEGTSMAALHVWADAHLDAADVVVRDTQPIAGMGGGALHVDDLASATVRRLYSERNKLGVVVSRTATADLADVVLRPVATSQPAAALYALHDATLTVRRVQIDQARVYAVAASYGGLLQLEDARIADTLSGTNFPEAYGVTTFQGGRVEARRVVVDGASLAGVALFGSGRSVLVDLDIRGVRLPTCAATTCPASRNAVGLSVSGGAGDVTAFRLAGSEVCGALVAQGGQLDLHRGVVSGNPIGINVQVPGYDVSRLSDRVIYLENGVNLDSASLPLPPAPTL